MTNYEKYKSEIEPIARMGRKVAIERSTNKICVCLCTKCVNCLFYVPFNEKSCNELALEWADAEYIEPEVDWSKVPIDTPILVSNNNVDWYRRHFAKYVDGEVYVWNYGVTSFTTKDNKTTLWFYAKLAEVKNYDEENS